MLNRLLQYNYSAIGIFLFLVLLKTIMYFTGQVDSGDYEYSLFQILENPTFGGGIIAAMVTLALGILILINSEKNAKRTDFSFWIVLIFGIQMSYHSFYSISVEHFGLLCFIISLFAFSRGINKQDRKKSVVQQFNLSFFIAIGTFFTPHLAYILPVFWICQLTANSVSFKGIIASITGFTLPFIITDVVIFSLYADKAQYVHLFIVEQLKHSFLKISFEASPGKIIAIIPPISFLLASLYLTLKQSYSLKIVIRKFNNVNLIILVYIVLLITFRIIPIHFGMMLIFVPTAYFYSNFQTTAPKLWQNIFAWSILISGLISYPPISNEIISLYQSIF